MHLFLSGHLANTHRDILGFLAHSEFNLLPASPFRLPEETTATELQL